MTALVEKKESDFIENIREVTTEDLRQKLAESLRITAHRLIYLAAIVQELERRGDDLMSLRLGMVRWLRAIAKASGLAEWQLIQHALRAYGLI